MRFCSLNIQIVVLKIDLVNRPTPVNSNVHSILLEGVNIVPGDVLIKKDALTEGVLYLLRNTNVKYNWGAHFKTYSAVKWGSESDRGYDIAFFPELHEILAVFCFWGLSSRP